MRQALFVEQNREKWLRYERAISNARSLDPDEAAMMYVHLTEDLAFARAKYPKSKVSTYLADLSLKIHHHIYRNKPEKSSRLVTFWTKELPQVLHANRRNMLISFLIIMTGVALGWLSASNDAEFVRLILGDSYVEMTYRNIEEGDPMAVYKGHSQAGMFFMITINNIRVSFLAFALGILASVGTGYILFTNGIMLGVFHQLFFSRGLFDETILTIWIHGTLEISAIVMAGGAGLAMGNALLFPKSYPRRYSLQRGAKEGVKILLSLVPFFIVAGFLESVITRNTHWPLWSKLIIIGISASIVIFYLFILPKNTNHVSTTD